MKYTQKENVVPVIFIVKDGKEYNAIGQTLR